MLSFGSTICAAQISARPKSSFPLYEKLYTYVSPRVSGCTGHHVKSSKFSKSSLSGYWKFSILDAGLLEVKKIQKVFFKIFFIDLFGKMFENISPDSVQSGRTCPANLGVRSCPVRKLIFPVQLSPT